MTSSVVLLSHFSNPSTQAAIRGLHTAGSGSRPAEEPAVRQLQRRGLEQMLHDAYNPALNRISPISATNPNRSLYLSEAEQFLAHYGGA